MLRLKETRLRHLAALSLLGCSVVLLAPTKGHAEPPIVAQIRIEGNQRIEKDAILTHVPQQPDQPLDENAVTGDIRFISEMGFFSSVSTKIVEIEGEPVL